jgi:competence protein ComEC
MPLFWIAFAFLVGLLCGKLVALPLWVWISLCAGLLVAVIIGRKYYRRLWLFTTQPGLFAIWPVILLLSLFLGGLRNTLAQPRWTENDLAWYNDHGTYLITAVVSEPPDERETATYLHITAREIYDPATLTYRRISGEALVYTAPGSDWQLGDVLRFSAAPKTPSDGEDFSYRDYLQRLGIETVIYRPAALERVGSGEAPWWSLALDGLRQRAAKAIFTAYPQPESGLMAGILLGNDNNLPANLKQAYRDTGTAHIIAISGFNMSVLAAMCTGLFSRAFNRRLTFLLSAFVLIAYTLFVGASPSVVRAMVMALFAFGGQLIGRSHAGLNGLGLSALLMTALNPLLPWDASFQLSFAATLGLLLFATPMKDWLYEHLERRYSEATAARLTGPVCEYFLYSLAAQLLTLPVIALQFHRLSLTSLVANPLVLPVQPAVLVCGMIVTFTSMLWPWGGRLLGTLTWPLVWWSNAAADFISKWDWGTITLSASASVTIAVLAVLAILAFILMGYFVKKSIPINWFYVGLATLVITVLAISTVSRRPDGRLHLWLVRADDGSTLFLRGPQGSTLLIDPDGSPGQLASAVSNRVSPWDVHADGVLLTQRGRTSDLDLLTAQLPVRQAILTLPVSRLDDDLAPVTLPEGMEVKQLAAGEVIQVEAGLTVTPIAEDGSRTAVLIEYVNTRILVPGGVDPALLVAQQADNLSSLSLLILNEADVATLPADMWGNFGAQVILWNSPAVTPLPGWIGFETGDVVEVISDGTAYSVK